MSVEDLLFEMQKEQSQRDNLAVSAAQSYRTNPDQHAGNVNLAKRAGVPPALMPELSDDAKMSVLLDQMRNAPPAVSRFVSEPENLKLSHDDVENMSLIEKGFSVLKNSARALASVPWGASADLWNIPRAIGDIDAILARPFEFLAEKVTGKSINIGMGEALSQYATEQQRGSKGTAEAIKGDTSGAGMLERGLYSGVDSIGRNVLTLPLTIMSGSPAPMLGSMTAMTGGQGYGEARDKNLGVVQSLVYGANQAGIEYLTEVAPALLLVKNLKAKSGIMKFSRDMAAAEIPNEQYATALQDLNSWATLNPEKPFSEYVKERPAAAVETLIATIVGTGGMVVTAKGLEKVGASVDKFQEAGSNRDFLLALGDGVKASKLRERMPEKMQELIKSMKEEHGTPEHAYVDAQILTELWQSAGLDPQKKAAELLSNPSDYLEALATGSEIAIPLEEFALKFTGEEYYKALLDDVRLGTGSATIREAQEFDKTGKDKALAALLAEAEGIAPTASDVKVYDDVLGQLIGTGMERGTAERNALVMKSVFRTLGARTGIDAHELFKQYGLTITRPLPEALSKRLSVDLSIDPLLDRLRAGDIPKDSAVRGKSLTEMLRQKGVKDSGGELKQLDPDKGKSKKLIRNKDGYEMDQALTAAKEQGYLPEDATIADFLDAVSNDLQGRGVYSDQALNTQLLEDQLSLTQMKEYLESRDIDIAGMSNEEIRKALQDSMGATAGGVEMNQALPEKIVIDGVERWTVDSNGQSLAQNEGGVKNFWAWFGDSKIVDGQGKPKVVYHQTSTDAKVGIFETGFDISKVGARGSDEGVPDGVFMKPTDNDIRIGGKEQINLYASLQNPFLVRDRESLDSFLRMSEDYFHWSRETNFTDKEKAREFEKLEKKPATEGSRRAGGDFAELEAFLAEWEKINKENAGKSRAAATKFLKDEGFDGVVIQRDSGSFGREVETIIAFSPTQIKSAIGNNGAFDPNDPNILHQSSRGSAEGHEALSVRKTQAEGMLLTAVMSGGKVKVAGIGATHYDVNKDIKVTNESPDANGFVTPDNQFLNRKEALIWLKENRPDTYKQLDKVTKANGLESQAYAHAEGVTSYTDKAMTDFMARQFGTTPGMLFQSAWHGSPHDHNKFSTDKIGSGEGAQAYGYGLYFAGDKEVAQHYRDNLSAQRTTLFIDGIEISGSQQEFYDTDDVNRLIMDAYNSMGKGYKSQKSLVTELKSRSKGAFKEWKERFNQAIEKAKGDSVKVVAEKGKLYKVELAPAEDEYLLWDKPLSEQSEKVKAALDPAIKIVESVMQKYPSDFSMAERKDMLDGDRVYDYLGKHFGSDKAASEYLHSLGIRGVKYADGNTRNKGKQNFNYVIFSEDDVSITEKFQNKGGTNRGFIRFGADRKFNIGFLENADLSTFIHEGGHFYFEVLADLAERDDVPQQIRDDFQTLLNHVGAKSRGEVTTEQHEIIARSFEAYLMEGKAPSVELQGAFQRMKAWLVQVYKEIRKLNVKLNDDVRGVFDRLVASDEEIEAARERSSMKELFTSAADMGVSEAEFQIYRKQGEKAHAAQIEKLEREYMAELTRQNKLWWTEGLKKITAEVDAETQEEPVYIAVQVLTKGVTFQGAEASLKLDRKSLEKQYGKSIVKRLPRGIYAKEGGMTADQVAEMMGFESGADMVEAIITMPTRKEYVTAEADRRMRAQHGDLLTDGSAAQEAALAVHSDEQGKVFGEELRAMRKMQVAAEKIVRAKEGGNRTARNEALGSIPPAEFFKDLAREMVAKKTIGDLNPYRYEQAGAKSGREAFEAAAKKDWSAAAEAKQRQILNHYLYREAAGIKKMVDKQVGKWLDLVKKSDKRLAATRDMNIVTAARAILAQYGIGDSTDKAFAALQLVQQYDANLYESLQMAVDVAIQEPKPYKEMDVIEFIGLMDAVNNLWHLSRRSKVAMIDGLEVGLEEINDELIGQIGLRSRPLAGIGKTSAVSDMQKFAIGFLGMGAALKRVEHWSVEMDRGDSGPFRRFIVQPIFQAVTQYKTEKKPVIEKLREIFSRLDKETFADKKIAASEIGYTFKNKGELLHAVLHTGNESNLKKLLVGRGWATADENGLDATQWEAFLARMYSEGVLTQDDYVFAQEIWDLLDSTKAAAQKAHHDMYGFYFSEVTAAPVTTPFGIFRGGYVPAITDPYIVESAAERSDQENLLQDNSSSMFPATTGKGFTMARVAGYNKPLLLDLGLLAVHVDKVLRFSFMGPAIQDVGRIVGNSELKEIFKEINPGWSSEMLIPWLKRTARQVVETKSSGWGGKAMDAIFRGLRRRTGLQLMAANIANAAQQLTGIFPAMVKVDPRRMGSALLQFSKAPRELTDSITSKSPWMRDRLDNEISQISGELREILVQSKYEKAQDFGMRAGYWVSGAAQHIVDVIAWQAAYEQAVMAGEDERSAVSLADSTVRQTQGSFAPEDASSFEAGSPFVRLFTQFYSYFNMIANLSITESKNAVAEMGWKGGSSRLFYIYLMAFALPSFLSEVLMSAMRGKIDDDDDGEYIDDLLMMFFRGQGRAATALIPGAGQVINAAVGRFTKMPQDDRMSVSPAVGSIEGSVGVGKDLYDVLLDGKELKRAHVRDVFTLLGMVSGLPTAAIARPLGYAVAAESGKTEPANSADYVRGLLTGYAPRP